MEPLHTSGASNKNFPKEEKLTSKKEIQELFDKGSSFYLYPFLIKYAHKDNSEQKFPKVLISIPKRKFKKAVDRNRLKRQIREVYRLNKHLLLNGNVPAHLGIIYTASEKIPYDVLEKKLNLILHRFQDDE